jgi:large subunit ribosomal protein L29
MKASELRERSTQELETLVGQLQDDLFKLKLQKSTNQIENTMSLRSKRREIAVAKTVLSARHHGEAQAAPGSSATSENQ